jgi:hypothetical protein
MIWKEKSMSAFCRTKAVMYPIGDRTAVDALCRSLGAEDRFDLEELKPELFESDGDKPHFKFEAMVSVKCTYYLSYVLFYEYGASCGEFGRNRFLSQTEQEKYKSIFEQVLPTVDTGKLKYVDYCYYNASESPDFYNAQDEFNTEI